jgi:hypothetical protein
MVLFCQLNFCRQKLSCVASFLAEKRGTMRKSRPSTVGTISG